MCFSCNDPIIKPQLLFFNFDYRQRLSECWFSQEVIDHPDYWSTLKQISNKKPTINILNPSYAANVLHSGKHRNGGMHVTIETSITILLM